jgi:hypothetical protein
MAPRGSVCPGQSLRLFPLSDCRSSGLLRHILSVVIRDLPIGSPAYVVQRMASLKIAFIVFSALCGLGVFVSLERNRGKTGKGPVVYDGATRPLRRLNRPSDTVPLNLSHCSLLARRTLVPGPHQSAKTGKREVVHRAAAVCYTGVVQIAGRRQRAGGMAVFEVFQMPDGRRADGDCRIRITTDFSSPRPSGMTWRPRKMGPGANLDGRAF